MLGSGSTIALDTSSSTAVTYLQVFWQGMLINLLNPKVMLLMFALLPQFVDPSKGNVAMQTLCIGTTHAFVASLVLTSLVYVSGQTASLFRNSSRVQTMFRYLTGSILIGLGIRVALATKRG